MLLQGGANVSGGQKQRLALPGSDQKGSVCIFDLLSWIWRPTPRCEALREHTGESTIFIVAQRVSSIMNADQIIVLNEGRIVASASMRFAANLSNTEKLDLSCPGGVKKVM